MDRRVLFFVFEFTDDRNRSQLLTNYFLTLSGNILMLIKEPIKPIKVIRGLKSLKISKKGNKDQILPSIERSLITRLNEAHEIIF